MFPQQEEARHEEEAIHGRTNCPGSTATETTTIEAAARQHGMFEQSLDRWKRQLGQIDVADVREWRHRSRRTAQGTRRAPSRPTWCWLLLPKQKKRGCRDEPRHL